MTSNNTPARRRAAAAYHAKREAAGMRKVVLWLSAEAVAALEAGREDFGSRDGAADFAIRQMAKPSAADAAAKPPRIIRRKIAADLIDAVYRAEGWMRTEGENKVRRVSSLYELSNNGLTYIATRKAAPSL